MSGSPSLPHLDIPGDTGLVVAPVNVVPDGTRNDLGTRVFLAGAPSLLDPN